MIQVKESQNCPEEWWEVLHELILGYQSDLQSGHIPDFLFSVGVDRAAWKHPAS